MDLLDRYVFSAAFFLLASSLTIVVLGLNMFLDKAFKMQFSRFLLAVISIIGTYCFFIFSQTAYFSNVLHFVSPGEVLYPAHPYRAVSITGLGICACLMIIFLNEKAVWKWIVGGLFALAGMLFVFAPYLVNYNV